MNKKQTKKVATESLRNVIFIRDLAGFVKFAYDNGMDDAQVMTTVAHDLFGYIRGDEFSEPRSSDYRRYLNGSTTESMKQRYFSEYRVIDGLNQHPSGLGFKDWLKQQRANQERK